MISIDARLTCPRGKAPTEEVVDIMSRNLSEYQKLKKMDKTIAERYHWFWSIADCDTYFFQIVRDIE